MKVYKLKQRLPIKRVVNLTGTAQTITNRVASNETQNERIQVLDSLKNRLLELSDLYSVYEKQGKITGQVRIPSEFIRGLVNTVFDQHVYDAARGNVWELPFYNSVIDMFTLEVETLPVEDRTDVRIP